MPVVFDRFGLDKQILKTGFNGYAGRGFQKEKKKLTDIGFLGVGLSLGSDQNLMDHWFSSDIGLIDK